MSLWLEALGILGDGGGQHKLAFQLPAVLLHVFFLQDRREERRSGYRTIRAGCPSLRIGNQRKRPGRNHLREKALVGPATAERSPRLQMDVGELPFLHLAGGPGRRLLEVRRIRQTWTVHIAQVADTFHYLGIVET